MVCGTPEVTIQFLKELLLLLNLITFDHPGAGGQHVQGGRQGVAVDPLSVLVSRGLS